MHYTFICFTDRLWSCTRSTVSCSTMWTPSRRMTSTCTRAQQTGIKPSTWVSPLTIWVRSEWSEPFLHNSNFKFVYYLYLDPLQIINFQYPSPCRLMYEAFIGGATILTEDQVRRSNGYSNDFWGWGGEDDDFYARSLKRKTFCTISLQSSIYRLTFMHRRVNLAGMKFWRPSAEIGRYRTFGHKRDQGNTPNR